VKSFFARLKLQGRDARHLSPVKLAVIGSETAAELERHGIVADVVPAEFRAEAVVAAMQGKIGPGDRVLIARATEAREVLPHELNRMGALVDVMPAYTTVLGEADGDSIRRQLLAGEIDIVTFTSSSTVTNLLKILGDEAQELLDRVKIACIGPVTADTCREHGLSPDVVATEYTIKGLAESIIREMGGIRHE
jgi:uroporphyrinogen III methyltransferase/synthase